MSISIEALLVILLLVAPGYMTFWWVRHLNHPMFKDDGTIKLLVLSVTTSAFITFATLGFWGLLSKAGLVRSPYSVFVRYREGAIVDNDAVAAFVFVSVAAFLVPTVIGLPLGMILRLELCQDWLEKVELDKASRFPTAWGYHASSFPSGSYAIVTLDDGTQLGGALGKRSRLGRDEDSQDIYIQTEWEVDEGLLVEERKGSLGVWISPEHIVSIRYQGSVSYE